MKEEVYGVITFESTHHAIKGEKTLMEKNITLKTIPTPREITASCGLSIMFSLDDLENVKEIISEEELSIKGIYKLKKIGFDKTAELIV